MRQNKKKQQIIHPFTDVPYLPPDFDGSTRELRMHAAKERDATALRLVQTKLEFVQRVANRSIYTIDLVTSSSRVEKSPTIDFALIPFLETIFDWKLFASFMDELRDFGCFVSWWRNSHLIYRTVSFSEVNTERLEAFKHTLQSHQNAGQTQHQLKLNQNLSLQLYLSGNFLCISGKAIGGQEARISKLTRAQAAPVTEAVLEYCKKNPKRFQTIIQQKLIDEGFIGEETFKKSWSNPLSFKKYITKIGLKGELRELFFAVSSPNKDGSLGFKFRTAVPELEWVRKPTGFQQKVVNTLLEKRQ